tara:strand:+ start:151 stop:411 length:261 start_codon:yes stop_codon:yes gene_type:complete
MKKINVETLVPASYNYVARDLNGSLYAFEEKPSLATDIACDTWDTKTGEVLEITSSLTHQTSTELLDDELGDWRESLIEINNETIS